MQQPRFLWIFLIFSLLFVSPCWPTPTDFWQQIRSFHPVVTVNSGIIWTSDIGHSASFSPNSASSETYQYFANHTAQTSSITGLFLGGEWQAHPLWLIQAGLGYHQASPFNATSTYLQGVDTASQNLYNYHYGVLMRQLMLEGKLLYSIKSRLHPYFLAGLGSSFNKAYNYYTNVPPYLTFTRQYSNNSSTSFTYEAGIGVDYDILQSLRLGIGYRFTDGGKFKLGAATINTTNVNGTLSQSNLYANELMVEMTWIS